MAKELVKKIDDYAFLYRDPENGLAWVEDGHTGLEHSCHAGIDETGSVEGMKAQGYWNKSDRTVRSHGFTYNIDSYAVDPKNKYEKIAADACMCAACRERREMQGRRIFRMPRACMYAARRERKGH